MKRRKFVVNQGTSSSNSDDKEYKDNDDTEKKYIRERKGPQEGGGHIGNRLAEAHYRASWHGTSLCEEIEKEEVTSQEEGACGIATRSSSHGNLQEKSRSLPRLKLFKRRSYNVPSSLPSSPSKSSSQSGFKSLFTNIRKAKKSSNENVCLLSDSRTNERTNLIGQAAERVNWNISTESESDQTQIKRVRTSPELEKTAVKRRLDDSALSSSMTQSSDFTETGAIPKSCSASSSLDRSTNVLTLPGTRPYPHPIHTFQIQNTRNQNANRGSNSIFSRSRTRDKKSVIKEVEANLMHPAILAILSVINFALWAFLFSVWVCRVTARVSVWTWLRVVYVFDFIWRIFCRLFNQDPDKANQNSDYTHIESEYTAYFIIILIGEL